MCKASEGVYKKHQEKRYGIKACKGKLENATIEDLYEDIDLLKYLSKTKNEICNCDFTKLTEYLT